MNREIEKVKLEDVHYDQEFNCRGQIIPRDVIDLAKDIEKNGLLQPIVISQYSKFNQQKTGKKYLLIAGYRRFTAYRVLKKTEIKATILPPMTEADARFMNLSENTQRSDLNILQESRALKKLFELGIPELEVAERLGKSRGWVQVRFIVLKLPEEIQEELAAGILVQSQIRDIYMRFKKEGKEEAFKMVRKLKDAKINGKTIRVKRKTNPKSKRHRKRPEIFTMMEHIENTIGLGLWSRCLAWTAGEISDLDLHKDFKAYCQNNGLNPYEIPDFSAS